MDGEGRPTDGPEAAVSRTQRPSRNGIGTVVRRRTPTNMIKLYRLRTGRGCVPVESCPPRRPRVAPAPPRNFYLGPSVMRVSKPSGSLPISHDEGMSGGGLYAPFQRSRSHQPPARADVGLPHPDWLFRSCRWAGVRAAGGSAEPADAERKFEGGAVDPR